MSQLEAYLDMDSTDEKMHKKMRQIREKEAKEIAKKQQKEIAKKAKLDAKLSKEHNFEEMNTPEKPTQSKTLAKERETFESRAPTGKGMQLGKPKKMPGASKCFLSNLDKLTEGFGFDEPKGGFFAQKEDEKEPEPEEAKSENVHLKITELVQCEVTKFGDVCKFNVRGTVGLMVDEGGEKVTKIDFVQPNASLFKQFKVHPEIDKSTWKSTGSLSASDEETGFAPGSNIDAIIYKYAAEEEAQLPFDLNIFTTKAAGGKTKVSLELEYTEGDGEVKPVYRNMTVAVSVTDQPKLLKLENSTADFDQKTSQINWVTEGLSPESENAILQFYTTTDEETLFPLKVSYEHENSGDSSSVNTEQMFLKFLLV